MLNYSLVSDVRGTSLTVFTDEGDPLVIRSDHANFERVREGVLEGSLTEDEVRTLINVVEAVAGRLTALSERVSLEGNTLYFDNDPIRNELSETIVELVKADTNNGWKGLVAFLEKVLTNPNEHSQDSLYSWIRNRKITITPDGNLIAYKGVYSNGDGTYKSVHAGKAIVDGVVVNGQIPNNLGSILEMPRSDVQHSPSVACSTGLHAGTWSYASSFAPSDGAILLVEINPRDVVSVPTDCAGEKIRVCRYKVISATELALDTAVYRTESDDEAEDLLKEEEETFEENLSWEDLEDLEDPDDLSLDDLDDLEEDDLAEDEEDEEEDPVNVWITVNIHEYNDSSGLSSCHRKSCGCF